jgi:hypothetical protein
MLTAKNPPLGGAGHQFKASSIINGAIALFGYGSLLFNADKHNLNENSDHSKPRVGGYPFKNVASEKAKAT